MGEFLLLALILLIAGVISVPIATQLGWCWPTQEFGGGRLIVGN